MDTLRIQTAQHVEITVETAGLGERIMAALVDLLVIGAWVTVSSFALGVAGASVSGFIMGMALPALLYHPFCEVVFDGRSVGKAALGTRVARLDGSAPGPGAALLRWALGLVELWATFGVAAILAVLLGRTGQRLGDYAAGTALVRVRAEAARPELARAEDGPALFPEAAFLSPVDAETIRDVLRQLRATGRTARSERLARRTKEVVEQKLGLPEVDARPTAFLRQVLADYERGPSGDAW